MHLWGLTHSCSTLLWHYCVLSFSLNIFCICLTVNNAENRKARKQGGFSGDLLGWVEFHHRQARPEMSRFILRFWKATQAHRWKGSQACFRPRGTAGSYTSFPNRKLWCCAWTLTCHTVLRFNSSSMAQARVGLSLDSASGLAFSIVSGSVPVAPFWESKPHQNMLRGGSSREQRDKTMVHLFFSS